jgi:acetylornithine deacetylase/succinyl-diaminopimelate desuccinylase-like protein
MPLLSHNPHRERVAHHASQRSVHAAFAWLHGHPKTIMDWQMELTAIPAPPFGEEARSAWMAARFNEIGLTGVRTDTLGNVFATLAAAHLPPESSGPVVFLSAHLDTVFPAETPIHPQLDGDRLQAPGACDNGAGLAGLLAIAQALVQAEVALPAPLVFLANVGEEGEGDLRGIRHLYKEDPLAGRIAAHLVLDGAGAEPAVCRALGSRRFRVTVQGPGGHSFTDAGTPNPIAALSAALAEFSRMALPDEPRTTFNIGSIHGGVSVNAIPEEVQAALDLRSTSPDQLLRMEVALFRAVEDAVEQCNRQAAEQPSRSRGPLRFHIDKIGDRPAAVLPADSPLLEALYAVDRHLGLRSELLLGSTDANIPLSLGVPALSLGAGGQGGGAHTLSEWYSGKDRETGLRRVLLLTLVMLDWAAGQ